MCGMKKACVVCMWYQIETTHIWPHAVVRPVFMGDPVSVSPDTVGASDFYRQTHGGSMGPPFPPPRCSALVCCSIELEPHCSSKHIHHTVATRTKEGIISRGWWRFEVVVSNRIWKMLWATVNGEHEQLVAKLVLLSEFFVELVPAH